MFASLDQSQMTAYRDTLVQRIAKRYVGFIGGMFIALFLQYSAINIAGFRAIPSIVFSNVFGTFLAWGLAFNETIRCFVLLAIPSFLSGQGRAIMYSLIVYILISRTLDNIIVNCKALGRSGTCLRLLIKTESDELGEMAMQPVMGDVISFVYTILHKIIGNCEYLKKFDFYKACVHMFEEVAYSILGVKYIGGTFGSLSCTASVVFVHGMCATSVGFNWMKEQIVPNIREQMEKIAKELAFNGTIRHSYYYRLNESTDPDYVFQEIEKTVDGKLRFLKYARYVSGYGIIFTVLLLFIWVFIYHKRWNSSVVFDNYYVDRVYANIDEFRHRITGVRTLPLRYRERRRIIDLRPCPFSSFISFKELLRITVSLFYWVGMLLCSFTLTSIDYGLWRIMLILRKNMNVTIRPSEYLGSIKVAIEGDGLLGGIFKDIVGTSQSLQYKDVEFRLYECIPMTSEPSYYFNNIVIGILLCVSFFTCIFQGFTSRLRNMVMSMYHPNQHISRINWLYNHILLKRTHATHDIFTRSHEFLTASRSDKLKKLFAVLKSKILHNRKFARIVELLGFGKTAYAKRCIGCMRDCSSSSSCTPCSTIHCIGSYCQECWAILNNVCPICRSRELDLGSFSEELGSEDSDDSKSEGSQDEEGGSTVTNVEVE